MYLFSVIATAKKDQPELAEGQQGEFIVYIDFKDQAGAKQLCKFYVASLGFSNVVIEKMKLANADFIKNSVSSGHRKPIETAQKQGYYVQFFTP
jgi:hypothetical protein